MRIGKPDPLGVVLCGGPLQGHGEAATCRAVIWLQLLLAAQVCTQPACLFALQLNTEDSVKTLRSFLTK